MPSRRHSVRLGNPGSTGSRPGGFTLIELMVVIGIAMVILTLAAPVFVRRLAANSIQQAVNDVMEICRDARAHAILKGCTIALQIRPAERTFTLLPLAATVRRSPVGEEGAAGDSEAAPAPQKITTGTTHVTLDPSITVEGLGINGEDWTEDAVGEVRFYSNGTSDEMSIVLLSGKQERRNIWLEVVTALAEVETEISKFRAR